MIFLKYSAKKFVYNYSKIELINRILLKTKFYNAYHKKLELPKTFIYSCKGNTKIKDEFTYPVVLKPSNGVLYYKHPFENQGKVYKLNSFQDVCETIRQIENSGYDVDLIIQEFVPGWDSNTFYVAFYFGKDHTL